MKKQDTRHDRLAMRLSLITSRLLAGETLSLRALANEFGVSERTIQRDLHERLSHLDLVSNEAGYCLSSTLTVWRTPDLFSFLQKVGLASYFPGLTRKTVNHLVQSDLHFPCFMLSPFETEFSSCDGVCFYQLIQAITQHFIVQVKQKEGIYLHLEPYRLALYERAWYLIGYASPYVRVIPLHHIQSVHITEIPFRRRKEICRLSSTPEFISALPHFEFIQHVIRQINHFSH